MCSRQGNPNEYAVLACWSTHLQFLRVFLVTSAIWFYPLRVAFGLRPSLERDRPYAETQVLFFPHFYFTTELPLNSLSVPPPFVLLTPHSSKPSVLKYL